MNSATFTNAAADGRGYYGTDLSRAEKSELMKYLKTL
jgi:hypothetical protein